MSQIPIFTRMSRAAAAAAIAAAALLFAPSPGHAASSNVVVTDHTELALRAAQTAVDSQETLMLGLHFKMKPGWKVYWRSPGPGGYPPRIDWSGSENVANAEMQWPAPERFTVLGFETLGYKKEAVYPIKLQVLRRGEPVKLRAKVNYLTCDDICVPYEAELKLDIGTGAPATSAWAHLIDSWRARLPLPPGLGGIKVEKAVVQGPKAQPVITVTATSETPFARPDIYIEGPKPYEFSAPTVRLSPDRKTATLRIGAGAPGEAAGGIAGKILTLTVVDGKRAIETVTLAEDGGAAPPPPLATETASGQNLWAILIVALLGGLILNVMPCVLPVLSIKLMNVVTHAGAGRAQVRKSFLATAAGILASFMVLAAASLLVKSAGIAVGWGVQFQQPVFLVAMILLLIVFAANLWGAFDITLPGGLTTRLATADSRFTGYRGDFLIGAFATLLATPCSAPFLGTAVGFALAGGAAEIVPVFAALAVGFAAPYLLIALFPGLARMMPKPGRWMAWVKIVMGFALAITAVWLLTVLAVQIGATGAIVVAVLASALLAAIWFRKRLPDALAGAIMGVLAFGAVAAPSLLPPPTAALAVRANWTAFDLARIPVLVAEGKVVFVDVTADWCLTCKANKAIVLDSADIAARLNGKDVIAMVADWTRPDDGIAAYLASFGRYGIPFNAVYGPATPDGQPLPELLTREAVLKALDAAARKPAATAERQ